MSFSLNRYPFIRMTFPHKQIEVVHRAIAVNGAYFVLSMEPILALAIGLDMVHAAECRVTESYTLMRLACC